MSNSTFDHESCIKGDLRGVAGGDRVRDAAVRWGDGGEHQAAAAAPRGDPQAAHAPPPQGSV